jgi:hypothetical protein
MLTICFSRSSYAMRLVSQYFDRTSLGALFRLRTELGQGAINTELQGQFTSSSCVSTARR